MWKLAAHTLNSNEVRARAQSERINNNNKNKTRFVSTLVLHLLIHTIYWDCVCDNDIVDGMRWRCVVCAHSHFLSLCSVRVSVSSEIVFHTFLFCCGEIPYD